MFQSLSFTALVIAVLAVWRITHLLWGEDGPANVLVRLRSLAGHGFVSSLLDCFYCLSLWVAAPVAWAFGVTWVERGLLWIGLSGGAILLERATDRPPAPPPPAIWHEEPGPETQKQEDEKHNHVMLR
jgi:hypothetical protein